MTAETLDASQVKAIQHAGGNHQTCHDEVLHELAQACASAKWLQRYMGRLDQRRFYRQQKYHSDGAYRKAVILSNNARTQLKREDLEYRAHEAAPQCKRRQEAKASSK